MTKNNPTKVLKDLFTYFHTCNVNYCVVGDSKDLPQLIPGDIDIVVSNDALLTIQETLFSFASTYGLQLTQVLQHEQTAFYFVLSFKTDTTHIKHLFPDICGDYYGNGKKFLTAKKLLAGRRKALTESGEDKGFYIPVPPMEFIYYLIKKIYKGVLEEKHLNHLLEQFLLDPGQCSHNAENFWTSAEVTEITSYIKARDLTSLQKKIPQLQKTLADNCRPTFSQIWQELLRKIKRVLQPTGIIVALLGPDGCGKSTIGDHLIEEIKPVFRGVRRLHLWPDLFGRNKQGESIVVTDPHGKKARGRILSICKLFYFIIEYSGGYLLKIKPLQMRSHLVVFDRYFHDMLIDPLRYRFGAPLWLARLCSFFIPEPDIFIIFDGPADIIHARKQEVCLAETKRQREAYLSFVQNRNNCILINTNQDIAGSVADTCEQILNFMEKRVKKRTGAL